MRTKTGAGDLSMKKTLEFTAIAMFALGALVFQTNMKKWSETGSGPFIKINNPGGAIWGYSRASEIKILTVDGLAFKDLNINGKLDKYEDWRLSAEERAKDLAAQMSLGQIAGLMLYSLH
jgi:beta-glucosidase